MQVILISSTVDLILANILNLSYTKPPLILLENSCFLNYALLEDYRPSHKKLYRTDLPKVILNITNRYKTNFASQLNQKHLIVNVIFILIN